VWADDKRCRSADTQSLHAAFLADLAVTTTSLPPPGTPQLRTMTTCGAKGRKGLGASHPHGRFHARLPSSPRMTKYSVVWQLSDSDMPFKCLPPTLRRACSIMEFGERTPKARNCTGNCASQCRSKCCPRWNPQSRNFFVTYRCCSRGTSRKLLACTCDLAIGVSNGTTMAQQQHHLSARREEVKGYHGEACVGCQDGSEVSAWCG